MIGPVDDTHVVQTVRVDVSHFDIMCADQIEPIVQHGKDTVVQILLLLHHVHELLPQKANGRTQKRERQLTDVIQNERLRHLHAPFTRLSPARLMMVG